MKLYSAKIPVIARDMIKELNDAGDIEVNNHEEAELDIQSVLKEYQRLDRETTEKAKDLLETRKLPYEQFGKIKRQLCDEKGLPLGEESLSWICTQAMEILMQSKFVDEVYASDADMRRKMKEILKRHMMVDDELDSEVRNRIKNLQEGTANWEIEYAKVMEQIKQKKGIKD